MSEGISPNARRWLNTIAFAEGTWGSSGPRYNITHGYEPIFDLSKHPDRVVKGSAAAGAYQFMPATWRAVQQKLGLPDFGPASQDKAALELMRARGINPDTDPITRETLAKLAPEWASLPTMQGASYYGQPVKSFEALSKFAQQATPARTAAPTSKKEEVTPQKPSVRDIGALLLNKFLGTFGVRPFDSSALPSTTPPNYRESASPADPELNILLNAYSNQLDKENYMRNLQQQAAKETQSFADASDAARAKLLAQAIGSFTSPSSLI